MKRLLLLSAISISIFALIMTSCRQEDNNNNVVPPEPTMNPLVGTWYQVGPYANISTKDRGRKVIFTETNVTLVNYYTGYPDVITYDNIPYTISEDKIQMTGLNYDWAFDGEHTTKFAFNNDTLWIEHFLHTLVGMPYPDDMDAVLLIKEEKIKW